MSLNAVIDLSHWNTVASFAALESAGMTHAQGLLALKVGGILGVFHKATQGMKYVDPRFLERQQPILDAGLLRGAYHFGVAGDGYDQADHFLETLYPDGMVDKSDLLALDWEHSVGDIGDMSIISAENFCLAVEEATGRWPVLYSGQAFLTEHIRGYTDTKLIHCPLWIARYSTTQKPIIPPPWSTYAPPGGGWTLWQYTDGEHGMQPHTVDGVGKCDRSYFHGTEDELRALWTASTAST